MRIFVSAAERSGDLHAANLVREVARRDASVRFEGFGGELLAGAGCDVREDLVGLASMGVGFLRHLSRYFRALLRFQRALAEARPAAAIFVDSPGLHFLFARIARWRRVPAIAYICPQIWAWGPWRRARVLRYADLLLAVLPFEEALWANPRVPVRYVGHPLADDLALVPEDAGTRLRERLGIGPGERVVGLLPGSRRREIEELLPVFLRILRGLRKRGAECRALVSCFLPEMRPFVEGHLSSSPFRADVVPGDSRALIRASDFALVASGTASLEAAYFEKPMVVLYPARRWERWAYGLMAVTPRFALPNILGFGIAGGEPVVPERLTSGAGEEELAELAGGLLAEGETRERTVERLRALKRRFLEPGATRRAADAVLEFLAGAAPAR
ncbi:MAG: lipid-A-disaccharide synthase [Planctomycetota bacterium]